MAARFSIMKVIASLAVAASMSQVASAAPTSWVGGAGASAATRNAWGSTTNWSAGVPNASNDAVFGSVAANLRSPTISGGQTVKGITFNSGAPSYSISGGSLSLGSFGINQNSANAQTIITPINLAAPLQIGGTATSNVLNIGSNMTASSQGQILTVAGVTVNFTSGNNVGTSVAPEVTIGAGGVVQTLGNGIAQFGDVLVQGNGRLNVNTAGVQAESYTGSAGSTTQVALGYAGGSPSGVGIQTTSGDVSYAGNIVIDWSAASITSQGSFTEYVDTWNVFQSAGSFLNSGDIQSVTLTGISAGNAFDGFTTFVQNGSEWTTESTPNAAGQWLVFSPDNGNLVVVPEPSTIVFAGVGVAMAGWSAWKKRRLAKVLAKK